MSEKLDEYKRKRDFGKTAEPSGEASIAPSGRLRFLIQKHAATRLHYDFRLEHDGALLSWAVTRGPSLDPHDKRLAVETEPHPIDYGDFEGTIPKGEYGGGTVMLWDRGYWAPEPGTSIEQGLAKGDLKFVLEGERLHGGWVLVKIKNDRSGGKRSNWLLIKHRDDQVREGGDGGEAYLAATATSVASGRTMEQIASGAEPGPTPFFTQPVKGRSKRASAAQVWNSNRGDPEASAVAAVEEVDPKPLKPKRKTKTAQPVGSLAVPDFVDPELCRIVDRPPPGAEWVHEIKFDGYRMQLRIEAGAVTLRSRRGLDWTHRFPEIAADSKSLPNGLYDGEIVALDEHGAPDFAGLQAALSDGKTGGLVFFLFDQLFAAGEDLRPLPLRDRKVRLEQVLGEGADKGSGRLRFVEHFESGGDAVLSSACRMHLEGIVSKRLDAPYRSGRSENWTKAKCRGGQEVVICGWTTTGDAFRSLIAGVHRDGRLVHVGRVGTGFGREKVVGLLPKLKAVESDVCPFSGPGAPRGGAGVHWVRPELVAEIESAGWTGDGHLRQASFKALREDKPAEEVVAETPADAPQTVPETSQKTAQTSPKITKDAGKSQTGGNVVLGVSISNPAKPLWPADAGQEPITKLDLARYFEAVGEAMLPHIKGRPCSVIRAPDGTLGERFFQRHAMPGTSSLITLATYTGDRKPYIQLDRIEALIAAAQTGGVELHPWNCAPDRYDVPGRLVFDLDPSPETSFDDVITAAHEVKARLEGVGLVAFCKTTGGKGLHVVTPLTVDASVDWPTAKAFARDLCAAMAADAPDRFLINMAKAKRTGKIFLDYLRNDRLSTAVAPYSPRARPGAPVSWPITWAQVKKGLDPMKYTLRTAPALLRRNRAWDGYDEAERPVADAIARLKTPKAA